MKAVVLDGFGDESVLTIGSAEAPQLGAGMLRIRVGAAGINRADLMQRMGLYPPPPGASGLLGLEVAGEVAEVAADVSGFRVGDRAMALLSGGGYAQEVVVDAGSVMHVPERLSIEEAAAIPEVFLTVYLNVFQIGGLKKGGALLVHGGGSGIGTAAIQLAKAAGATCIVTAGSERKCQQCRDLGADVAVNYKEGDFAEAAREATAGRGVDVVLDHIGGAYFAGNLKALAVGGSLVIIGLMQGAKAEINLASLLMNRHRVVGSTLRARPSREKTAIVAGFLGQFGDALQAGRIGPIVDRVLPLERVADAHRVMQASEHFGKIVLAIS
jgi:putative PIG3 family NAD(P)H quinone oxidoreductase